MSSTNKEAADSRRFWKKEESDDEEGSGSSSSNSSSDDSDDSDKSGSQKAKPAATAQARGPKQTRFEFESDSDSDDNRKRIAKSEQERKWDKLRTFVHDIRNAKKINDWSKIQESFNKLTQEFDKSWNVLRQHGGTPRFYVKALAELETAIKQLSKEDTKKMSRKNATGFNRTKQDLKKYNEKFRQHIDEYLANPDEEESEASEEDAAESDSASSSSSEEIVVNKAGPQAKQREESSSSEWSDDDESVSSDESSDDERNRLTGRARWVKRTEEKQPAKEDKKDERKRKKPHKEKKESAKDSGAEPETTQILSPVEAALKKLCTEKLSPELVGSKIQQMLATWGKRDADRNVTISSLEYLTVKSLEFGDYGEYAIPVIFQLARARLDAATRTIDSVLPVAVWRQVLHELWTAVDILNSDVGKKNNFKISSVTQEDVAEAVAKNRDKTSEDHAAYLKSTITTDSPVQNQQNEATQDGPVNQEEANVKKLVEKSEDGTTNIRVIGSLMVFLQRLSEEFMKSLQSIDPHTIEYVQRIPDEQWLIELAERIKEYYSRVGSYELAAETAHLILEHSYYRHNDIAEGMRRVQKQLEERVREQYKESARKRAEYLEAGNVNAEDAPKVDEVKPDENKSVPRRNEDKVILELAQFVYAYGDDRQRTRTCLCQVFYDALHDRFFDARDMLLMSKLQETIDKADASTQILFNRVMAQLGACAFRNGLIKEAHACLQDLCSTGRTKELLAQGVGRQDNRQPNVNRNEKAEKRRMMPYHMHIHADLLEACHLTSAMLLEVPNMAAAESAAQGLNGHNPRVISRSYRRLLDQMDRKTFIGPPETIRDTVMCAGMALARGDWKQCENLVLGMRTWHLWAHRGYEKVHSLLKQHIREAALVTFMHTFAGYYDSLSHERLSHMFDLDMNTVHSSLSKMMINDELPAAWDQPTATVVMHRLKTTPLQALALEYAGKVAYFVESNEDALAARQGVPREGRNDGRGKGGRAWMGKRFDPRSQGNTGTSYFRAGRGRGGGRGGSGNRGGRGGNRESRRGGRRQRLNAYRRR
eukprot:gb/GECG01015581.1/.p1 GENE.gb/GECG01015581.1/~~gb/GECG01015581.1/.p1  ORF type:complete len:1050 (+),score=191.71 gb/GECG01015581.1/:1-3150(+)